MLNEVNSERKNEKSAHKDLVGISTLHSDKSITFSTITLCCLIFPSRFSLSHTLLRDRSPRNTLACHEKYGNDDQVQVACS